MRRNLEVVNDTMSIAKIIVDRCLRKKYEIYTAKLEIMMIVAYGEYLALTGKRLFDAKITIGKIGPMIKKVDKGFEQYICGFHEPFYVDKLLLSDVEKVIRTTLDEYGDKVVFDINDDPRLVNLRKYKRFNKTVADEDIRRVFSDVKIQKKEIRTPILCSASEKGKWIVNACLNLGFDITTYKLEKLLVLAYGEYLVKTGKKLFNEDIMVSEVGIVIKEVDQDFIRFAMGFTAPLEEYYPMLNAEEKIINSIIYKYGNKDAFELTANAKLKELVEYKNSDGFVSDEDIKKVFEKYM